MLSTLRASAGSPGPAALRLILAATVALGLYLLFFHRLAERDLWSSHEGRAAMNGQTLVDGGDWRLPALLDGTPELQKPPLYYWLVALTASTRGGTVDALSVRLPATVTALLTLGLLLFLGWRLGRWRLGVMTAVILATTVSFPMLARTGRIDMPLTLAVSTTIVAFHLAGKANAGPGRGGLLLGGYAALAAGILLKGPIAVVLPAAVLLVQAVVERRAGRLGLWWGIPLVLLLAAPWFVYAHVATDGLFTKEFFWYHNLMRGLGGSTLRTHPWWVYGPQLAWGFLPWSLLLPVAGWWCWRNRAWREDAEMRLGLIWLLTVLVVLSCSAFKRADYLLPAFPGAALFLASVVCKVSGLSPGHDAGKADGGPVLSTQYSVLSTQYLPQASSRGVLSTQYPVLSTRYAPQVSSRGVLSPQSSVLSPQSSLAVVAMLSCLGWFVYVEWLLPLEEPRHECRSFAEAIRGLAPAPESVTLFRSDAHALEFHLGRPYAIFVEWRQLAERLAQPGRHYVVMPPAWLAECRQALPDFGLEEVLRNTTRAGGPHDRPLVLLRADSYFSR